MFSNNLILIFISVFAAVLTFFVNVRLKQGPVKASAGLSLLVALLFYFFPHLTNSVLASKIPLVFFGASFAGMSSGEVMPGLGWMAVSGVIFGLIYTNTSKFFTGFGGGLGTTALISVLITLGVIELAKYGLSLTSKRAIS